MPSYARRWPSCAVQSDQDVFVYQSSDQSPIDRRQQIQGGSSARSGQKAALGDLNGDGRIDLVTVADSGASVFLGQQGGSLLFDTNLSTKLTSALAGSVPTAVALADMDVDGIDYAIVASGTSLQGVLGLPHHLGELPGLVQAAQHARALPRRARDGHAFGAAGARPRG